MGIHGVLFTPQNGVADIYGHLSSLVADSRLTLEAPVRDLGRYVTWFLVELWDSHKLC